MAPPLLPYVIATAVIAAIKIFQNMSDKERAEAEERAANANFDPSYISPSAMDEIMRMAGHSYGVSITDEIEKLARLREKGDITQEEFEILKRKTMDQM